MKRTKYKNKNIKYLLYFLVLLVAGSFVYQSITNKPNLKISNISLISDKKSCKVSFNAKNLTEKELLVTMQITVVSITESREGTRVHDLGSKEIEITLLPLDSKEIQEVVETIDLSWPYAAVKKRADVRVIEIKK